MAANGFPVGAVVSEVSVDTDALGAFVDAGRNQVSRLEYALATFESKRHAAASAGIHLDGAAIAVSKVEELIVETSNNNRFVNDVRTAFLELGFVGINGLAAAPPEAVTDHLFGIGHLLSGGNLSFEGDKALQTRLRRKAAEGIPDGELREAVLDGLPPPSDEIQSLVLSAILENRSPVEVGLDKRYFPREYRAVKTLDDQINNIEYHIGHISGLSPLVVDHSGKLGDLKQDLDHARQQRGDAVRRLGFDPDSAETNAKQVGAIVLITDMVGDRSWEGEQYGHWYSGYQSGDDRYGPAELETVGERIVTSADAALGFFNSVSDAQIAYIPTLLADPEANYESIGNFGVALGQASLIYNDEGLPKLRVRGDDLVAFDPPITGNSDRVHPASLFIAGRFDDQFLADATTEILAPGLIVPMVDSQSGGLQGDARNIMLAKASHQSDAAALVINQLDAQGNNLEAILSAANNFDTHYYKNLHDGESVVTSFLVVAGQDSESARMLLNATSLTDRRAFDDAAVAAGIDGVLALHATEMFTDKQLADAGLEPTSLNYEPGSTPTTDVVTAADWSAVFRRITDHRRGQALAAAAAALIVEAIRKGFDSVGNFDAEPIRPFASMSARIIVAVGAAAVDIAQALDEEGQRRNGIYNDAVTLGLGLVGFAGKPAAVIAVGTGLVAPLWQPYEIDHEVKELRYQLDLWQTMFLNIEQGFRLEIMNGYLAHLIVTSDGRPTIERHHNGIVQEVEIRIDPSSANDPWAPVGYQWHDGSAGWKPFPDPRSVEWEAQFAGFPLDELTDQSDALDYNYGTAIGSRTKDQEKNWSSEEWIPDV